MEENHSKSLQPFLLLKIFLTATLAILVAAVHTISKNDMNERKVAVLEQKLENLNNTYRVSINRFEIIADSINSTVVNRKDILELLYKAKYAKGEETLAPLREELYIKMKPYFDDLKKVGVIITLFSFENNKTFLRVHKPNKFNDDLSGVRYSFSYVNQYKQIIRGLEEGKISHAFRNIYPIFYKGEYLGSVDIAFSSTVLKKHMEDLYNTESHFIVNKNVFKTNIWKMKNMVNYLPSIEHEDFLRDKKSDHISEIEINVNNKLKEEIYKNIAHQREFALEDSGQVVAFLPVTDIKDKKVIAYLVSYTENAYLMNLSKELVLTNLLSFVILLIVHIVIFLVVKSRHKEKKAKETEVKNYLDIAQVLIMALDHKKNVTMINNEGAKLLGYSKDEMIGKSWIKNFVPKDVRSEIDQIATDILDVKNDHNNYENYVLTKSGELKLILWQNRRLYNDKGEIVGILTSGQDITELKRTYTELEKKNLMMIQQSRLAQMGEMISMIAHQWRQPIAVIAMDANNMLTDIALDKFDMKASEKYANSIIQKTQHLSKTIDDFRNFFKSDKMSVEENLENIILKTLDIIKSSLINDSVAIIEEYNSKEEIELYDSEIMQVILNILKNSQDNFKEKQIEDPYIKIITEDRKISICDNGGGVSEDIIDKIFDPYFSTKDDKNGTGLGLYMSKTIIEEHHNGKLDVQNTDDGVCFIIELGRISNS